MVKPKQKMVVFCHQQRDLPWDLLLDTAAVDFE